MRALTVLEIPSAYPAYRSSDVPWLGDVPEHWKILPGKACYSLKQVPNKGMQEATVLSLSYGQIKIKPEEKLHGLVPASFETYQVVEPGDIICRPTDLQNDWTSLRFGLSQHRGIITSAYMCFDTRTALEREYGYALLHAYDLKKVFYGLGSGLRQNLSWSDFKSLPCLVPSASDQIAIVRYLDHVDRRIQRYIRAKRKLIGLLEEQKQAVINQAVTRGLDSNVRLKPSGVEWLGDVPEHWEVCRLGQIARSFRTGPFGSILHQSDYIDDGIPVINPTHMNRGRIVEDMQCSVPDSVANRLCHYRLEQHDLVFARRGELGRCALVRDRETGWLCGTGAIGVRVNYDEIEPEYLVEALQGRWVGEYLSSLSVGSTMDNLNTGILRGIPLALPPIHEQKKILVGISEEGHSIDRALENSRRQIEMLEEYRTRLIADVVTGKLDVREAAVRLPEEGGEYSVSSAAGSEEEEQLGGSVDEEGMLSTH